MTIEERERRFKETLPAAVAALTAVINEWAEVTECEGVIDVAANIVTLEGQAAAIDMGLYFMALTAGLNPRELNAPLIFLVRRMLEAATDAPTGELGEGLYGSAD